MKTFCIRKYRREYLRSYRAKNPEKVREYNRAYRLRNRETINSDKRRNRKAKKDQFNARQRAYYAANPERYRIYYQRRCAGIPKRIKMTVEQLRQARRERWFRKAYGISTKIFDEMLAKQNGKCAICHCVSEKWVVDHCHNNGHVRGILCHNCNVAIGFLKHSAISAESARDYLL